MKQTILSIFLLIIISCSVVKKNNSSNEFVTKKPGLPKVGDTTIWFPMGLKNIHLSENEFGKEIPDTHFTVNNYTSFSFNFSIDAERINAGNFQFETIKQPVGRMDYSTCPEDTLPANIDIVKFGNGDYSAILDMEGLKWYLQCKDGDWWGFDLPDAVRSKDSCFIKRTVTNYLKWTQYKIINRTL